jgi:osmotically-inducible protein OsmY
MSSHNSVIDRVRGTLANLGSINTVRVETGATEGTVVLLGHVASGGDKSLCGIVARTVPGVRRVENQIEVHDPTS